MALGIDRSEVGAGAVLLEDQAAGAQLVAGFVEECDLMLVEGITQRQIGIGIVSKNTFHLQAGQGGDAQCFFDSGIDTAFENESEAGHTSIQLEVAAHGPAQADSFGRKSFGMVEADDVSDDIVVGYSIIVSPMITSLRQGLSTTIQAKIVDNTNVEIADVITLTVSGADSSDNYLIVDNGNNSWTLTNKLKSKAPLTLTFSNTTYNVEYTMDIQLKAMF